MRIALEPATFLYDISRIVVESFEDLYQVKNKISGIGLLIRDGHETHK